MSTEQSPNPFQNPFINPFQNSNPDPNPNPNPDPLDPSYNEFIDNEFIAGIVHTKRISAQKIAQYILINNADFSKLIQDVNTEINTSDETFLKLGDELVSIKTRLENKIKDKNGLTDNNRVKKIFTILKNETAKKVKVFDISTINKVVKISSNAKITAYRNDKTLPNRWGTLYVLASLSDDQIDNLIITHNITSEITRKELSKLVDDIKGKVAKEPVKALSLCEEDGNALSDDKQNEILSLLEKYNLHFKIHAGKKLHKLSDYI